MKLSFSLALLCGSITAANAFAPQHHQLSIKPICSTASTTSLHAIGALAKKAKEATVRQYVTGGVEDEVMEKYNIIKEALEKDSIDLNADVPTPLQDKLTKRKGTITVIAEFKRKLANSGYISDKVFVPEVLSPEFREFGATAIAVMADERMGGCTYDDLKAFVKEQQRAKLAVPGPVSVINNDMIVDEIQIAQTAAYGAEAVVLTLDVLGEEKTIQFMKAARALDMESFVAVSSAEDAQKAMDIGARMVMVVNAIDVDAKRAIMKDLKQPEDRRVSFVAGIMSQDDNGLEEIEEAWACRDSGFNAVWVNDVLYKGGADTIEHPGAVIKSMTAKSSLKWASPIAKSGRGEGAREYLGDIMM